MLRAFAFSVLAFLFSSGLADGQQDLLNLEKAPTRADSYTVEYAGRLFGYYRFPEVQTKDPKRKAEESCAGNITAETAPEAARFKEALEVADKDAVGTKLRLASGDNFAPFLLAREMWDADKSDLQEKSYYGGVNGNWIDYDTLSTAQQYAKAYTDILNGGGSIPADNVGCFFRRMKFDAIVPGAHDFYFAPSRLQYLARYLALKATEDETPTKMLGVNLVMKTKAVAANDAQVSAASAGKGKPPGSKVEGVEDQPKIVMPKNILPWMRSVQIQNFPPGAEVCIVNVKTLPADVTKICDGPEFRLKLADNTAKAERRVKLEIDNPNNAKVLDWDTEYAVAVMLEQGAGKTLVGWQSFSVAPPFFGYERTRTVSAANRPWLTKPASAPGAKAVTVFGVVDPSLMQFVGRYNYVWLEAKPNNHTKVDDRYETDVQVADPAESLGQAVEYCEQFDECKNARKIVLAQMPQQVADAMVASFRDAGLSQKFDLVITQADDSRGSGNKTFVGDGGDQADPVVVVPETAAKIDNDGAQKDKMRVRLARAIVTPGDSHAWTRIVRNVSVKPAYDDPITTEWIPQPANIGKSVSPLTALAQGQGADNLLGHLRHLDQEIIEDTSVEKITATATDAEWEKGLKEVALKAMARTCQADVAMIQNRDIYFVRQFKDLILTESGFRAIMNAIFWKGDYVQCMNVSGSIITSVLQRSQELQQKEFYGSLSDLPPGNKEDWSLKTLGANEEQTDASLRVVSGHLLDPKKLYSIAVTDFMGTGDTGYPALQGAEPPPQTRWSKIKAPWLASTMTDDDHPTPIIDNLDKLTRVSSAVPPPDSGQTNQLFAKWLKSVFVGIPVTKIKDPFELGIQGRPTWSISLYKADFAYSLAAHSGLERNIPATFPGVSAVDLTAADSSSITFDYIVRLQRDTGGNEFYEQSEANYGYRKTRQASKTTPSNPSIGDPYVRNQPADFIYNEFGYARHFYPNHENPKTWKLQIPMGVQTQLAPLVSLPEGVSGPSGSPATIIASPRSYFISGRPGVRWEFSYPKPATWSAGGGGGQTSSSASSAKGGKGSTPSGSGSGSGGGAQNQTFDSFLEFGYQFGPSIGGPNAFVFSDPSHWLTATTNASNAAHPCAVQMPEGSLTTVSVADVVNCFNAASNPVPKAGIPSFTQPFLSQIMGGRTHFQNGLYLNYRLDTPLPIVLPRDRFTMLSNVEVISELRGDFFFGHGQDTPVDTHFLLDAKESLSFPILSTFNGKLSFSPSIELIYYTNKISDNLYRSYSTSVSLNYTFDWRQGLNWAKVIGYQNPVPASPTLPSR
jgi:hypothetical protein